MQALDYQLTKSALFLLYICSFKFNVKYDLAFQGIEGTILLRNSDGSFYLCPSKRDFYSPSTVQLALRLGSIHILRKHLYSTKLNLTTYFFTKNWVFSSKQKDVFFIITF